MHGAFGEFGAEVAGELTIVQFANHDFLVLSENVAGILRQRADVVEMGVSHLLTFVVEYDKIGEVFGTNEDGEAIILSDSDIEVSITNNGAQITGITLSYSIDSDGDFPAQNVVVATAYTYAAETPEFVKSIQ